MRCPRHAPGLMLLAACALFILAPSGGHAQTFPVPAHWIDGLPSDEVYVNADPLGLDAHRLVPGKLESSEVDLDLGFGSRSDPKATEETPAAIDTKPAPAEPAAAGSAKKPRAKPNEKPRGD